MRIFFLPKLIKRYCPCLSRCHRELRWHSLVYFFFPIFERILCLCPYLGLSKNQCMTSTPAAEAGAASQGPLLFVIFLVFSIPPGLTPLSGYFSAKHCFYYVSLCAETNKGSLLAQVSNTLLDPPQPDNVSSSAFFPPLPTSSSQKSNSPVAFH